MIRARAHAAQKRPVEHVLDSFNMLLCIRCNELLPKSRKILFWNFAMPTKQTWRKKMQARTMLRNERNPTVFVFAAVFGINHLHVKALWKSGWFASCFCEAVLYVAEAFRAACQTTVPSLDLVYCVGSERSVHLVTKAAKLPKYDEYNVAAESPKRHEPNHPLQQ